ncbi:hypothetical protein Athai_01930 [Actinocatenispora thailandica]|uniref:ATP/GTP-binding protein n=1 Tax=Actinocatenispora thailandica TaxID=227318 RepID=A0A7R7DJJ5_9ACTN|nr:hypothetical protein [Actinocatenispora thailandica]BCJ32690.1 hypothetical protein Athai_01930 [Actinocatenispora thailandica]
MAHEQRNSASGRAQQANQYGGVQHNIFVQSGPDPLPTESIAVPATAYQVRGRDQLLVELADEIHGRVTVLYGFRGVGTSTVAGALARRAGARTWFVRAADTSGLRAGMTSLAYELGASDNEIRARHLADLVWQRLDALDTRWLLVVDGVTDPGILGTDGTSYLRTPRTHDGALVVTTQNDRWPGWTTVRRVDALTPEPGGRVLLDRAPAAGSVESAVRLSAQYGNFPAALDMIGAELAAGADGVTTCDAYLARYAGAGYADRIEDMLDDPRIGLTNWLGSIGAHDFTADRLLNVLASLDRAPIPLSALLADQASLATAGGLPDGITRDEVVAALRELVSRGTAAVHDAGPPVAGPVVLVHPMMRAWIRAEFAAGYLRTPGAGRGRQRGAGQR